MQSENIHHQQFSGRLHYELQQLETWSDETLVDYIIYTMQRKGITEFRTDLFLGYFGCRYDRPEGWHLLFWPFLGGYRHTYEWTRVFLKNGELLFELEERISKHKYDLFEDTFLENIFPSPVGRTVGERYCPRIITHYHADEFFAMLPHLPIKDIQSKLWSKQHYLADVASSLQFCNPQREAAEAARRPKMTLEQAKVLADAPILKVRSMQDILDECAGKTKFSRRLLWMLLIALVIMVPLSIYLYNHQSQIAGIGYTWWGVGLFTFGVLMVIFLIIDFFDEVLK